MATAAVKPSQPRLSVRKSNAAKNGAKNGGEVKDEVEDASAAFVELDMETAKFELPKPDPPVVGKVTHCQVELTWDVSVARAEKKLPRKYKNERVKSTMHELDHAGHWVTVYCGFARTFTVENLEARTSYKFRLRLSLAQDITSEWSAVVEVSTTREPLTGEHLHKALLNNDHDEVKRILDTKEVKPEVPDKYGFTPLMQAAQKGNMDILELLLEHGAEIDHQNDAGKTALMLACFAGQLPAVKMLHERGASITLADRGGSTAMHWACDSGNVDLVSWLLRNGADVNVRDTVTEWTPLLRVASVTGNAEVARALINRRAEIDAVDKDGKTALMVAVVSNHMQLVDVMLEGGADVNVKNAFGKSALDMSRAMERRGITRALEEYLEKKKQAAAKK